MTGVSRMVDALIGGVTALVIVAALPARLKGVMTSVWR